MTTAAFTVFQSIIKKKFVNTFFKYVLDRFKAVFKRFPQRYSRIQRGDMSIGVETVWTVMDEKRLTSYILTAFLKGEGAL